jgi:ubiquinone/menaquinone biosynthesis C-methylase UbiE
MQAKIEILSTQLLDEQRPLVQELRQLAQKLRLEFGWHYLLDLTWILSHLGNPAGKKVIDAGAGVGVMQWYLAEHNAQVTSIDRLDRSTLSLRFRSRYKVTGQRPSDLMPANRRVGQQLASRHFLPLARELLTAASGALASRAPGSVIIYHQDLGRLDELVDGSFDAVVAVSALEHNPPDELPQVVDELMRVLKPGGVLLATLAAASETDWFHEPSQGWCYTAGSLRRLFDLPAETPDNYAKFDRLFAALQNCEELRDNLASFYARSGENGMPWGKWDPQYQPVGVMKIKE